MRDTRSREIVEIFADIVKTVSSTCTVTEVGTDGLYKVPHPKVNYIFGNGQYIKDCLDELSALSGAEETKLPLIALLCPVKEQRNDPAYYSKAKVRVLIACSSRREWSNEERCVTSFQNILRPLYRGFLDALREDGRFDFGYNDTINHDYSENYSYGRYGALTDTGEEVSEPIDAINISNLELTIKNKNCR